MDKQKRNLSKQTLSIRIFTPVVTLLGHVDHGKTTLLDAIRKTNIASKEHGGITQSIGASKIEFVNEGKIRSITFIDTPGHEAFPKMRERGGMAADIGLLVVSSVDGVMPQTKESIHVLKSSKIPFIVVLTKSDLPEKNPEKVKGELMKEGIALEGYGGDVPIIEISAKTNTNIKELLSLILLVDELKSENKTRAAVKSFGDARQSSQGEFQAVVIDSKQDIRRGPLATIVIKNGTIRIRDEIVSEGISGRVKSLNDLNGRRLESVTIGEPVEVLGFEKAPAVGSIVKKKGAGVSHKESGKGYSVLQPVASNAKRQTIPATTALAQDDTHLLSVILCADTFGSLEAILNALPGQINVIHKKTGEITPADIILAKSTGALVIGFNTKLKPEILKLARTEKVLLKNYNLIYELIDEIKDVLEGRKLSMEEEILGIAKIVASFPYEKTKVMGVTITDGRMAKGDKVRLVRNDEILGETAVVSLRQGKNPISKAEKGNEAGIIVSPFLDFTIGDMLISHG